MVDSSRKRSTKESMLVWNIWCRIEWNFEDKGMLQNNVYVFLSAGIAASIDSLNHFEYYTSYNLSGNNLVSENSDLTSNSILVDTQAISTETVRLRLENGGSTCAGRVGIHYRSLWGTVDDDKWDLLDASVVCRELDCGSAVSAPRQAYFGERSGPIMTWNVECNGTERALRDCQSVRWSHYIGPYTNNAGVICSDHTLPRLVPDNSQCFGRLEVQFGDAWKTMCGLDWDLKNANVVCAQLHCGVAVSVSSSAHSGGGRPDDTQTSSTETRSLRLENGVSPCAGRVEIHYKGQWGSVRGINWDLRDAIVVCRELDCGTAISAPRGSHFGPGTGPVVTGNFWCNGTEHALLDCTSWKLKRYNKPHNDDAGVICSEQVMLVPQNSECFGRLEVQFDHTWKTVCGLDWDLKNANVVCAQLHCGVAVSVSSSAHSGGSTVLMGSKVFECTGNETQLGNCPRSSTTHHDCSGYNNVTLTCSDESWSPRLVNGSNRCDGQLEVYYNGSWGRVQDTLWDLNAAHLVCRQLGCGYALETHNTSNYRVSDERPWVHSIQCHGQESQLRDCNISNPLNSSVTDSGAVGILCSEHIKLRLSDGGTRCAGRLEIYYKGTWGSVCDDSWDVRDAEVVCKQLDCGGALERALPSSCGPGSGPVWLKDVNCSGNESFLWECPSAPFGQQDDCSHKEDVRIMCSEHKEMRLVNGKHRCEGRVEVFYNEAWGTVCSESLDFHDGEVICKQLQCGALQSIDYYTQVFGAGTGPIWLDDVECLSHEPTLWQCKRNPWGQHNCDHREDAGVVCSDSQHSVSLVGGSSNCSGRVEILCGKGWGALCGDSWDTTDANVVCRQLGCGFAVSARGGPTVSQVKGVTWQNDVKCKGSESSLYDCLSMKSMQSECNHKEIASVICSDRHTRGKDSNLGLYQGIYEEIEDISRGKKPSEKHEAVNFASFDSLNLFEFYTNHSLSDNNPASVKLEVNTTSISGVHAFSFYQIHGSCKDVDTESQDSQSQLDSDPDESFALTNAENGLCSLGRKYSEDSGDFRNLNTKRDLEVENHNSLKVATQVDIVVKMAYVILVIVNPSQSNILLDGL
ncbi:scavenger receptor cysteine-rich domain-containing protein DMBT1-like [Chiloscyllium punctatum]|uniref:scavenger receptor cysteine-rich domain-containing protein DMBT1-like n=1 Tax=Chiloscyllium punctatum TaxID=137246 RepID=UPI003B638A40